MAKENNSVPDIKELLKAGVQFGHETRRWNPKMAPYIFGAKNNIHVIDITQTVDLLKEAVEALEKLSATGNVLFVGTKRQASELIRQYAIECGAYYIADRWVGGFFTNVNQVQKSLARLRELESMFDKGVEGRTKYEISRMKVEWQRLNRLYQGVKTMEKPPVAVVVIDPRFDAATVKEARQIGVPVVAVVDTNCNPEYVDYVIPGNDDAIGAIDLMLKTLATAVKTGNAGKGIKHDIKDYSKEEVKIVRKEEAEVVVVPLAVSEAAAPAVVPDRKPAKAPEAKVEKKAAPKKKAKTEKKASDGALEGGILGRARKK